MAIETTRRSSYTSPVEAIPDYGAFSRGFARGIQPGLDFLKQKEEREAIEKKRQELLGQKKLEAFDSIKLFNQLDTKATDMIDWDPNYYTQQRLVNVLKSRRSDFVNAIAAGDEELQKKILSEVSVMSIGSNNFNKLLQKATEEGYDLDASNTTVAQIQVDGKLQNVTLQDLARLNKQNPEAFDYNVKEGKYGNQSLFLDVNYNGQQVSLNLSELSDARIEDMFALNADIPSLTNQYNKENKVSPIESKSIETKIENGKLVTNTVNRLAGVSEEAYEIAANNFATATVTASSFAELKPSLLRQALEQEDMQGYFNFKDSEGKVSNLKDMLAYLQTEDGIKDYAEEKNLTEDQARKKISDDVDNLLKKSLVNIYLSRTGRHSFDEKTGKYEPKAIISSVQKPIDEITVDEFQGLYFNKLKALRKNPLDFINSPYLVGDKVARITSVRKIEREGSEGSTKNVNKIEIKLRRAVGESDIKMDPIIIDLDNKIQEDNFIFNTFGKLGSDAQSSLFKQSIQPQKAGSLDNIGK